MKKTIITSAIALLTAAGPANAAGYNAQTPVNIGPLATVGETLNKNGFYPILFFGQWYVGNPTEGVRPGSEQWQTQMNFGFDFNLGPLTGLNGTSIHFVQSVVPYISKSTNFVNYFTQDGEPINGSAGGFVPVPGHLARFTLEQQFLHDKLFIEAGKGYVNDYVARPDCLNAFTCMSVIDMTHKSAGFNFPNYSNWLVRTGYNITQTVKIQFIRYEYDNNASLTTGWNTWRKTYYPAWLADIQYTNHQAAYPREAEFLYFYNNIPQTDQLCLSCVRTTTHHQNGIFVSGMQTIWRPDRYAPTMLQAYASLGYDFNQKQTESPSVGGLAYALDTGLTMRAPFTSRPMDAYNIQFTAVHKTHDEQTWLDNQGYGANGPTEYAIDLDANFALYRGVFFSPYIEFIRNASAVYASNAYVNPTHALPRDGYGVGMDLIINFAQLSGLTGGRSGYDGHYP